MKTLLKVAVACVALGFAAARSEQVLDTGDYVIHYDALYSETLEPRLAKLYGIERNNALIVLSIAVLKRHLGLASLPVKAEVSVRAADGDEKLQDASVREVNDGGAIYYLAEFPAFEDDTVRFEIRIQPDNGSSHRFQYAKQLSSR